MKILHLGKFYPPAVGGMEVFLDDLCRAQTALGHTVAVLCHQHSSPGDEWDGRRDGAVTGRHQGSPPGRRPGEDAFQDGVRVVRLPTLWAASAVPFAPGFAARLGVLLRDFAPDVLHAHLPNLSALAALAALAALPPLVVHWHAEVMGQDLPFPLCLALPVYQTLTRRVLGAARLVVATSRPALLASPALAPFKAKCRVVPLGMDATRLTLPLHGAAAPDAASPPGTPGSQGAPHPSSCNAPISPRLRPILARRAPASPLASSPASPPASSQGSPLIFALGRFAAYKGFDTLVLAMKLLPGATLLIGGDGPLRPDIERLVRREGLEERVHLPGLLTGLERDACLNACDIFCLPAASRAEAFGLVLLEAMAHGKPVVAAVPHGSGAGTVPVSGVTGLTVPANAPAALAQALGWLAAHPGEARRMGRAGKARLEERFRIESVAQTLDTHYHEALARPKP